MTSIPSTSSSWSGLSSSLWWGAQKITDFALAGYSTGTKWAWSLAISTFINPDLYTKPDQYAKEIFKKNIESHISLPDNITATETKPIDPFPIALSIAGIFLFDLFFAYQKEETVARHVWTGSWTGLVASCIFDQNVYKATAMGALLALPLGLTLDKLDAKALHLEHLINDGKKAFSSLSTIAWTAICWNMLGSINSSESSSFSLFRILATAFCSTLPVALADLYLPPNDAPFLTNAALKRAILCMGTGYAVLLANARPENAEHLLYRFGFLEGLAYTVYKIFYTNQPHGKNN